jgi:hypothetical protein
MSSDAHIKDGQEKTVISSGAKVPDGESKILLMIAEQERRDRLRAYFMKKIKRNYDREVGLLDTISNFWANEP